MPVVDSEDHLERNTAPGRRRAPRKCVGCRVTAIALPVSVPPARRALLPRALRADVNSQSALAHGE